MIITYADMTAVKNITYIILPEACFHFGNWLVDDVIVIGWTDSDFRISGALTSVHFDSFSVQKWLT